MPTESIFHFEGDPFFKRVIVRIEAKPEILRMNAFSPAVS